jgi:uncharacterized cupredoxin-like copper-binding protein
LLPLVIVGVAVFGALAIAGCGGDDDEGPTAGEGGGATAGEGAAQTVDMSATEFEFDPSDPTVEAGTVAFNVTNDGSAPHNLEVEGPSGEQELEQDLAPGESGTLTVDLSEPGTYEMYCPVGNHRDQGMEGEITVSGAGGTSGSSSASGSQGKSDDSGGGGGGGYSY